jgi:hypothetical protein
LILGTRGILEAAVSSNLPFTIRTRVSSRAAVTGLLVVAFFAVSGSSRVRVGSDSAMADQASQAEPKDAAAAIGETRASLLQRDLWERVVNDAELRRLLPNATFRALICDERRFKIVDDPEMAAAFRNPVLQQALRDPGFKTALRDPRFGEVFSALTRSPAR